MKKLTSLMAIALCLIIGGVYATWSYAQGSVSANFEVTAEMGNVSSEVKSKGSLEMPVTYVKVEDDNNDHVAELVFSNDLVITFIPANGADQSVVDYGIKMQVNLATQIVDSGVTEWKYNGIDVFTIEKSTLVSPQLTESDIEGGILTKTAVEGEVGSVTKDSVTGKFTWTITKAELNQAILLYGGNELKLDTRAEYDDFKEVLSDGKLTATVTEYGATVQGN